MHTEALNAMRTILEQSVTLLPPMAQVLDVGSYDVNGTYRPLVESLHYRYTGLDLTPGPNVDIVADDPDHYPIPDAAFDVVISGSTMEHVARPWCWVPELVRVLRPGGLLAIVTHWQFPEHRYPMDYWRFMADGMRYVIEYASQWDIAAAAWKRGG